VQQLDRVMKGACQRLIINQPPRSLKSIAISVAYVAWRLGKNPALEIVVVSYNREFAADLHRLFRLVVESDWYRTIFPSTKWMKQTDTDFVTTMGGGRFATSIGGQLTGRGGDLVIIDDPMNASDAQSEPARKKVIDFFSNSLLSRLNDKQTQPIIIVMQRLHDDDLSGHLLEKGGWDHLNLPAIAIEDGDFDLGFGRIHHRKVGDVLHPARENLETLQQLKTAMGSLTFSAQYQQAPIPVEGNLVKRASIQCYEALPEIRGFKSVVQSWDIATAVGSTNDYSVCTTWLVTKSDVYLLYVWRGRLTFPALRQKVAALSREHKADRIIIEEAGPGLQLLQDLRSNTPDNMVRPIGIRPEGSKVDRMAMQAARIEAGMVHLPRDAPWLDDFLSELLGFPSTRHDDQVDSTSQFLAWWWSWRRTGGVIVSPIIVIIPRGDPFDAPRRF
jgi:predicted phage terminase large subunit-like protein